MANPYWDILVAVKAKLDAVSGHPTVDIRHDVMQFDDGIDTLPLIIVAPSPERQQPADDQPGTFDSIVMYDYPVDIVWIVGNARTAKSGLEAYLQLEHDIQAALHTVTLASVSAVFDTNQVPLAIARLNNTKTRARGWTFKYRATETRSGN